MRKKAEIYVKKRNLKLFLTETMKLTEEDLEEMDKSYETKVLYDEHTEEQAREKAERYLHIFKIKSFLIDTMKLTKEDFKVMDGFTDTKIDYDDDTEEVLK